MFNISYFLFDYHTIHWYNRIVFKSLFIIPHKIKCLTRTRKQNRFAYIKRMSMKNKQKPNYFRNKDKLFRNQRRIINVAEDRAQEA